MDDFTIKANEEVRYASGMRRDTTEGKVNYLLVRDGVLYKRYAAHLTKGADVHGKRNWTNIALDPETAADEVERCRESALRHFEQWLDGETDEDHAAAVIFNMDCVELGKARLAQIPSSDERGVLGICP